ncbi:MAG TPA: TIGR03118 family protein [Tepidisphaeraceae bacterium]|jgi:uncharacterized protein (TIGR03118 family)|nr:TIGR03118 family protein [Tepidisphaeraceae bacterium]
MLPNRRTSSAGVAALVFAVVILTRTALAGTVFNQTNLVVDKNPPNANNTDSNLINPWGLAVGPTGIFWASNQGSNTSTLYDSNGNKNSLVVNIPQQTGLGGEIGPTGVVFNPSNDFEVSSGNPAKFIFVGLDGSIAGWNPNADATNAITKKPGSSGAAYTGLALGNAGGNNVIYAANRVSGVVDVFDKSFASTSLSGSFSDPSVPSDLKPFNIVNIGDKVYVTYATTSGPEEDAEEGSGAVSVFDTSGNLLKHLIEGGHLASPWGVALAPSSFGDLAGKLLVGNFNEDGHINAFDPTTGQFVSTLTLKNGKPFSEDELWSLLPGNGADADQIFFTAGIRDESGGLFGKLSISEGGGGNAIPLPNMIYSAPVLLLATMYFSTRKRLMR